jgi:hypothetical protein
VSFAAIDKRINRERRAEHSGCLATSAALAHGTVLRLCGRAIRAVATASGHSGGDQLDAGSGHRRVLRRDPILVRSARLGYPLRRARPQGVPADARISRTGGGSRERNLDGTPQRCWYIGAVKPQVNGLQGCEGDLSVKPSTDVYVGSNPTPATSKTSAQTCGVPELGLDP